MYTEAAEFLNTTPRRNQVSICQYISMRQRRSEDHFQSHLQKLYYVADQTLKQEQQQAMEDLKKEKIVID